MNKYPYNEKILNLGWIYLNEERKKRRFEAKKNIISQAAIKVFSANGYERATTREIALEADIAEGTIYNYFQNKREILVVIAKEIVHDIVDSIQKLNNEDLEIKVSQIIKNQFDDHNKILTIIFQEARNDTEIRDFVMSMIKIINQEIENSVENLKEKRRVRPIDSEIVAKTISSLLIGHIILFDLENDKNTPESTEKIGNQIADLLMNGLLKREN